MDTKVNKACSYSQRVHCVVKEMNEPKETVNVERTAMEANTGTDCEGGKLKEEKMANTEAFLEMSLSEVSKTKKERDGSPRKMNYMCKGKHETWHLSISGRQSPRWIWKEAKFADGDGLLFMLIKGHGTLDSKRLLGDCMGFPGSAAGKESACNAGDPGSISGWGRSPAEGIGYPTPVFVDFPGGSDGKESACNAGDLGLIPRLGRSPGEGHDNALKYSCLENLSGQRSLAGYSPWGRKESDMTEQLNTAQHRGL